MAEKNIYIIRHGETEFNRLLYLQGSSINSSINKNGKKQADAFYISYKHIKFDKIYTSVLKRSIESVQLFIDQGIVHEQYVELNEINWGVLEGKPIQNKELERLEYIINRWKKGHIEECIPGGESPSEVALRQKKVIKIIFAGKEEKNILISMHGRAIRIFLCQLLNKPLFEMDNYGHDNLGLYLLHYERDGEKAEIIKQNCIDHLL